MTYYGQRDFYGAVDGLADVNNDLSKVIKITKSVNAYPSSRKLETKFEPILNSK